MDTPNLLYYGDNLEVLQRLWIWRWRVMGTDGVLGRYDVFARERARMAHGLCPIGV